MGSMLMSLQTYRVVVTKYYHEELMITCTSEEEAIEIVDKIPEVVGIKEMEVLYDNGGTTRRHGS